MLAGLHSASEILGESGPLPRQLSGFRVRPAQQAMAEAIRAALEQKTDLLVEAGTGTGKTLAYLVPAVLSGLKIIISTGTKNLQDQLIHRDVPVLRQAMKFTASFAVLKGRANYLCLQRYAAVQQESIFEARQRRHADNLRAWADSTLRGDIAECSVIPENDPLWVKVTSTVDNCLGSDCDAYAQCYVFKARRDAQAADIVIVNHHLLLSDMALHEQGFGELLPKADAYIIDEAHQLPEIASHYFSIGLSTAQCIDLATDSAQAYKDEINESMAFFGLADNITQAAQQLCAAVGNEQQRVPWLTLEKNKKRGKALAGLIAALEQLHAILSPLAERSKALANCWERNQHLLVRLQQLTQTSADGYVHWIEVHRRSVSLHMTPLDIADTFLAHKTQKNGTWIFTSATLTVAADFTHFSSRLGLNQARCLRWDSPFDYQHNTLLYLPAGMPDPNEPGYTQQVVTVASRILVASRGRAFLLFTSHRALQEAAQLLRQAVPYPLFVQGEASRDVLLDSFRRTPHAVLLGTSSFWEGVDVRGEALSCVIIDKLPFATPDDPVLQARLESLRQQGKNPFMSYQLPAAVITLKQGAGRLIRDYDDRGVLVICDPRLRSKPYGKIFLQSLPPMPLVEDEHLITDFFENQPMESAR
ncbi:MAG: ATP-dependent DNA helicase [Gammaproteobacteria bacterium]|nr:ATP-dependent DNA helicase [Gammaproteobacteria bacterium]